MLCSLALGRLLTYFGKDRRIRAASAFESTIGLGPGSARSSSSLSGIHTMRPSRIVFTRVLISRQCSISDWGVCSCAGQNADFWCFSFLGFAWGRTAISTEADLRVGVSWGEDGTDPGASFTSALPFLRVGSTL